MSIRFLNHIALDKWSPLCTEGVQNALLSKWAANPYVHQAFSRDIIHTASQLFLTNMLSMVLGNTVQGTKFHWKVSVELKMFIFLNIH